METLKDIFVPYDIAAQLEGIGFDEPCIAGYCLCQGIHPMLDQMILNVEGNNGNYDISAPTYEQVFKWFREKNYLSSVVSNFGSFYGYIEHTREAEAFATDEDYTSYEQAREQLILKLIEIYKNEQNI